MNMPFGRFARALLLTGGIATVLALPSLAGAPLMPANSVDNARVALAAPASDNNDDETNDNGEERNIEGQVLQIRTDVNPPLVLIGLLGEDVWARLYNDQLNQSGIAVGEYVYLQGEFSEFNIFDAYQVDVHESDDNDND